MPELPISDVHGQLLREYQQQIHAHMCYPQDHGARMAWLNALWVDGLGKDEHLLRLIETGQMANGMEAEGGINALAMAVLRRRSATHLPYYQQLGGFHLTANLPDAPRRVLEAAETACLHGHMAGRVMLCLLSQRCAGVARPSRRMAYHLLAEFAKRSGCPPHGVASVDNAWRAYRSVAHLWAARSQEDARLAEVLFPPDRCLEFLAKAEAYRRAANGLPRRSGDGPPVPDHEAWVPPRQLRLPEVEIEWPSLPPDHEDLLAARGYKRAGRRAKKM